MRPQVLPTDALHARSDANTPTATNPGGGSGVRRAAVLSAGFAPFADSISCDNSHWCSALTIDSWNAQTGGDCNNNCVEPINFAFIQRNGVPTGPPSPQSQPRHGHPKQATLLMNPGDNLASGCSTT